MELRKNKKSSKSQIFHTNIIKVCHYSNMKDFLKNEEKIL